MSAWKAKKFWKAVTVAEVDGGYSVELDGRPVRTPAKRPLVVPTKKMAEQIAREWDAVESEINPEAMPVTKSANAAIDKVAQQFDEVAQMIADYGDSDLTCYRADSPRELVARQAQAWDPLLDWLDEELNIRLFQRTGVMHESQSVEAKAALRELVSNLTPFQLTAFHDLVGLSGSLVIALAHIHGRLNEGDAWSISRIDEAWQIEQWGEDEEEMARVSVKRAEFQHACAFFQLCG